MVIVYKPTQKGIEFCRSVLEPYERIFPRKKESVVDVNNSRDNISEKPILKSSHQEQGVGGGQQQQQQQQQKKQRLQQLQQELPLTTEQILLY